MLDGAPVIQAEHLTKSYAFDRSPMRALRRALVGKESSKSFCALDDVTFSVPRGSAVGIVGRNGSGKSTLLQLICGTLTPSSGTLQVSGRIAAMLELGAGFNPDFTGRENVYLAAAIYGLDDQTIEERLPAIEAFANIGAYINRRVAEYSSGMYARLAFAVCAHVDADILVVDEILGVGDAVFQRKCQRFMHEFRKRGTLILVSHNAASVLDSCDRAIWLEQGRVMADGPAGDVLQRYSEVDVSRSYDTPMDAADDLRAEPPMDLRPGVRNSMEISPFDPSVATHGTGAATLEACFFANAEGEPLATLRGGEPITLHIAARVHRQLDQPIVGFMFRNAAGQNLFGDNTFLRYRRTAHGLKAGSRLEARLGFRMPFLPKGVYTVAPSILSGTQSHHIPVCWLEDALTVTVSGEAVRQGRIGMTVHRFIASPA